MEKAVKITLIVAISVLIVVFGGLYFVKSLISGANTGNIVSATGESKINVEPDVTRVYFLVETKDESANKAKNNNNDLFNKITTALIVNGIDKELIETDQFSINENFEWDGTKSERKGFIAQHFASVKLTNFDKIGNVIDAVVDNKGKINSVSFELSQEKQNKHKTEALKLATEDARTKAIAIAQGLGKNLGSLVSVQTSDFNYRPWPVYSGMGIVDKAEVERAVINPSEKEIFASVTVQYKLK